MGSKVGEASGKASGHTYIADEFRGGKSIKHKMLRTNRIFSLARSGGFDWPMSRIVTVN